MSRARWRHISGPARQRIQVRRRGCLAWVRFRSGRPGNALDLQTWQELTDTLAELRSGAGITAILLEGGAHDFCTGLDRGDPVTVEALQEPAIFHGGWLRPAPAGSAGLLVALICGRAQDEGFELALGCDLRIAAAGAQLGYPGLGTGRFPTGGATQRLTRLVGLGRSQGFFFLDRVVGAEQARKWGLLAGVVASGHWQDEVRPLASALERAAPLALAFTREASALGYHMALADGLELESDLALLLHSTRDRAKGIRAFQQRRRPRYRGE